MPPPDPGKIHSLPIQVFYNLPRPSTSGPSGGPERCTVILPQREDVFVHPTKGGKKRKHATAEDDRVRDDERAMVGSVSLKSVMRGVCFASPDLLPSHAFPDSSIYIPSVLPSPHASSSSSSHQHIHEAKGLLSLLLTEPHPGRTLARGRLIRSPLFSALFPSPRSPHRVLDEEDGEGGLEALMRAAQMEEEREDEDQEAEEGGRWGLELEVVLKALPSGFVGLGAMSIGTPTTGGIAKREDHGNGVTRSSPIRPSSAADTKPSYLRTHLQAAISSPDTGARPGSTSDLPHSSASSTSQTLVALAIPSRTASSSSGAPTPTPTAIPSTAPPLRPTSSASASGTLPVAASSHSSKKLPPRSSTPTTQPPPRAPPIIARHAQASLRAEARKEVASSPVSMTTPVGEVDEPGNGVEPIAIDPSGATVAPLQAQPIRRPSVQVQGSAKADKQANKGDTASTSAGKKPVGIPAPSAARSSGPSSSGSKPVATNKAIAPAPAPVPKPLATPVNRPMQLPAETRPDSRVASPASNVILARTVLQQGLNVQSIGLAQRLVGKEKFGELLAELGVGVGLEASGKEGIAAGSEIGTGAKAVVSGSTAPVAQAKSAAESGSGAGDKASPSKPPTCDHCGTSETKTWRCKSQNGQGQGGQRVCDECGIYFNDNKRMRPKSLWGLKGDAAVGKAEGQVVVPDPPVPGAGGGGEKKRGTKRGHASASGPGTAASQGDLKTPQLSTTPMSPKKSRQHPPQSYISPRRSTRLNTGPTPGRSGNGRPPVRKDVEESPTKRLRSTPRRGGEKGRNLEMGIDEHDLITNGAHRDMPSLQARKGIDTNATTVPENNEEWNEEIRKLLANAPIPDQPQRQGNEVRPMEVDYDINQILHGIGAPSNQAALESIDLAGVQPFQGENQFSQEDLDMLLAFSQQQHAASGSGASMPRDAAKAASSGSHMLNFGSIEWSAEVVSSSPWEIRTPNSGPSHIGNQQLDTGPQIANKSLNHLSPADQLALSEFMTQGQQGGS